MSNLYQYQIPLPPAIMTITLREICVSLQDRTWFDKLAVASLDAAGAPKGSKQLETVSVNPLGRARRTKTTLDSKETWQGE